MILESDIDHALEQIEDELLSAEPELDASNNLLNHLAITGRLSKYYSQNRAI